LVRTIKRRHLKKPNTALEVEKKGPSIIQLRVQQMRLRQIEKRMEVPKLEVNRERHRSDGLVIKISPKILVKDLVKRNKKIFFF